MADLPKIELLKPTEAEGYLVAAKGMFAGAKPLASVHPEPLYAVTLLCGHTCEAALKALLSKSGINANVLSKNPYGHNIINLWEATSEHNIPLPMPLPNWVSQLHSIYDKPFHLRYPLGFHGMVFPVQNEMLEGTAAILNLAVSLVSRNSNA